MAGGSEHRENGDAKGPRSVGDDSTVEAAEIVGRDGNESVVNTTAIAKSMDRSGDGATELSKRQQRSGSDGPGESSEWANDTERQERRTQYREIKKMTKKEGERK